MSKHKLLFIKPKSHVEIYKWQVGESKNMLPIHNAHDHSLLLLNMLDNAWKENERGIETYNTQNLEAKDGIYLKLSTSIDADYSLNIKSLDSAKGESYLLNVTHSNTNKNNIFSATVYIPKKHRNVLYRKIKQYANGKNARGKITNKSLVATISTMQLAQASDFWTDNFSDFPNNTSEWCEVWMRSNNASEAVQKFYKSANYLGIKTNTVECSIFPERIVVSAKVNSLEINKLLVVNSGIAEIRLARKPSIFFEMVGEA